MHPQPSEGSGLVFTHHPAVPATSAAEYRYWYQWYFHTERGRADLSQNRGLLCRLLWELWSPNYRFSDADYALTAVSFDGMECASCFALHL